jgi:hypothetical protein
MMKEYSQNGAKLHPDTLGKAIFNREVDFATLGPPEDRLSLPFTTTPGKRLGPRFKSIYEQDQDQKWVINSKHRRHNTHRPQ